MDVRSSVGLRGMPFEVHPPLAAVVAFVLFAATFALRLSVHGTQDHITSFYVLPIALLAMAFGLRGGAIAAVMAVLLVVAGVAIEGVSLTPIGWVGRAVPLVLLGVLLGHALDRLRSATAAEQALFEARLREREAAEISDLIIQELAAAKWSLEAGQSERGLEVLSETIQTAQSLVAALLRGDRYRHHHVAGQPDVRTSVPVDALTVPRRNGPGRQHHRHPRSKHRRTQTSTEPAECQYSRTEGAPKGHILLDPGRI